MRSFKNGQKVKFNNDVYIFDKLSKKGGKGEFAFIQLFGTKNINMKQVKVLDLECL